jgi:hypothetical protein
MEEFIEKYTVYVRTDAAGHIVEIGSSGFLQDTEGWTEIDFGTGDRFYHAQNHYLPSHILTDTGVWRYRLIDGVPVECSAEEIAEQEAAQPSEPMSDKERIAELEAALELLLSGVTE